MDLTYTVRNQVATVTRYSDLAGTNKVAETDTTYDDAGRTTQITHKDGSGTTLIQTTYTYDLASRLETETIDGTTHTLTYDAVNQLTDDGSNSYSFDLAGNRTMAGYQTGAGNQLTNDGVYTYTYDAEGNRVSRSKSASDETWTFGYNLPNQMTWMEERATSGGTLLLRVEEKYDALGRRIEESRWTSATGTVTTRFTYQGANVRADLDGSNALVMRYVRPDGVDTLGARISAAGVASWYLTDRQGTVQGNTDASGALSNKNTYDGFGARTSQTNASASDRYLYTGRELQADSGLQYNRHRWYDTRTGSWTTIDPKGFDAGDNNLYRYVKNGPTNATDPSGEFLYAETDRVAKWVTMILTTGGSPETNPNVKWEGAHFQSADILFHRENSNVSMLGVVGSDELFKTAPEKNTSWIKKDWMAAVVNAARSSSNHVIIHDNKGLTYGPIQIDAEEAADTAMLYWMAVADKRIELSAAEKKDLYKEGIARNKRITAAYAELASKGKINLIEYTFMGAAAFASAEIGTSLNTFEAQYDNMVKMGHPGAASVFSHLFSYLADGNQAVYKDMYWLHLAIEYGGIELIRNMASVPSQSAITAKHLKAFELIADGIEKLKMRQAEAGLQEIGDGNQLLFKHEQYDIVEGHVFKWGALALKTLQKTPVLRTYEPAARNAFNYMAISPFSPYRSFGDWAKENRIRNPSIMNPDHRYRWGVEAFLQGYINSMKDDDPRVTAIKMEKMQDRMKRFITEEQKRLLK